MSIFFLLLCLFCFHQHCSLFFFYFIFNFNGCKIWMNDLPNFRMNLLTFVFTREFFSLDVIRISCVQHRWLNSGKYLDFGLNVLWWNGAVVSASSNKCKYRLAYVVFGVAVELHQPAYYTYIYEAAVFCHIYIGYYVKCGSANNMQCNIRYEWMRVMAFGRWSASWATNKKKCRK